MRAFSCPTCRRLVTFESDRCLHCGAGMAFDPAIRGLVALGGPDNTGGYGTDGDADPTESALLGADEPPAAAVEQADHVRCANATLIGCNWLAATDEVGDLCRSCALTRTRPADGDDAGLERFAGAERQKRRLHFELLELGLPIADGQEQDGGLIYDLLSSEKESVTTGHADGVVTIDLAEEDSAHRESMREQLNERYRTMLGHLRHEVGHYYWTVLVADAGDEDRLAEARELFGDDREDYGEALDRHYENGAPEDWPASHVSSYATMHPMEDWAETWAHYLHLWDALQTAASYRVSVAGPEHVTDPKGTFAGRVVAPVVGEFRTSVEQWLPLSYALNALNRSLGNEDLYPFVLPSPVVDKLVFIDRAVAVASERVAPAT